MKTIDVRIRIAILWSLWAAAATFSLLLGLLVEPTALEETLTGEVEGFATDGGSATTWRSPGSSRWRCPS